MLLRRTVVTLMAATLMATAAASPAGAQDMYLSKTTGKAASAYWTQVDGTPAGSPFGNVHIGSLWAYETSRDTGDAFVWIDDFDCPPGVHPYSHDGSENGCVYKGFRHGYGYGLEMVVDKKLTASRLFGNLEMVAFSPDGDDPHGGTSTEGAPVVVPANVTWTGTGDLYKERSTYRWSDGTSSYSSRYNSTNRNAVVGGTIGAMGFDPDTSSGWLSSFREMSKGRSK